jgi:hypothetical protein
MARGPPRHRCLGRSSSRAAAARLLGRTGRRSRSGKPWRTMLAGRGTEGLAGYVPDDSSAACRRTAHCAGHSSRAACSATTRPPCWRTGCRPPLGASHAAPATSASGPAHGRSRADRPPGHRGAAGTVAAAGPRAGAARHLAWLPRVHQEFDHPKDELWQRHGRRWIATAAEATAKTSSFRRRHRPPGGGQLIGHHRGRRAKPAQRAAPPTDAAPALDGSAASRGAEKPAGKKMAAAQIRPGRGRSRIRGDAQPRPVTGPARTTGTMSGGRAPRREGGAASRQTGWAGGQYVRAPTPTPAAELPDRRRCARPGAPPLPGDRPGTPPPGCRQGAVREVGSQPCQLGSRGDAHLGPSERRVNVTHTFPGTGLIWPSLMINRRTPGRS